MIETRGSMQETVTTSARGWQRQVGGGKKHRGGDPRPIGKVLARRSKGDDLMGSR